MLAPLDNQVVFKEAFTNKKVFEQFVKDVLDIDVTVDRIETEKQFYPKASNIDIKIDVYAETTDHRFIIEIQKIQYDYNFDRFLHYFISTLIEQQKSANKYKFEKTVLGIVVLTRPYRFDQITNEPIKDNFMTIDFNPQNIKNETIKLWEHKIVFINPHKKYDNPDTPRNIQDWINLFWNSMLKQQNITLNLKNKGISKVTEIINYKNISPEKLKEIKIAEGTKAVLALEYDAGIKEEKKQSAKLIKQAEQKQQQAEQEKEQAELKTAIYKYYFIEKKTVVEIVEITGEKKEYIENILEL